MQLYTVRRTVEKEKNHQAIVEVGQLEGELHKLTREHDRLESKRREAKEAMLRDVRQRQERHSFWTPDI